MAPPADREPLLRARLNALAIVVIIVLVGFVTVADTLGFGHGSEFIFGSLIGTLAVLLGVQLPAFLRR